MPGPPIFLNPNGPSTLYAACTRLLIQRVDTIEDIGYIPYPVIEPVLRKLTNPLQLKKIEMACPQIIGEDADLWRKFIERDFGRDVLLKCPSDPPKGWSRVYDKCTENKRAADAVAAEALKAKFSALSSAKHGHKTQLLEPSQLPPARGRRVGGGGGGGSGSGWGRSADNWSVKAGSKTKNAVAKARREVKEMSYFRSDRSRLGVPMHALKSGPVGQNLKDKIKKAESSIAASSTTVASASGHASSAVKRKHRADDDDEEDVFGDGEVDQEDRRREEEKKRRREAWMTESQQVKRRPIPTSTVGSPPEHRERPKVNPFMPKKKVDPFMPKRKPMTGR